MLTWSGDQTGNIPGGLLVSTVAFYRVDPSHFVVEKIEHRVQTWKGSEVDQPFVVYGQFEAVWKV